MDVSKNGKSLVFLLIQRVVQAIQNENEIYQLTDTLPDACSCPNKADWISYGNFCYSYNEGIRMSYTDGVKYCEESVYNYDYPGFMISFIGSDETMTRKWMNDFNLVLNKPIRKRTWSSGLLKTNDPETVIEWSFPEGLAAKFNQSATKTLNRLEKQNNFGSSECIYFDRQGKMSTSTCNNRRRVVCQTEAICQPKVTLEVPSLMRLFDFLEYNKAISGHGCWCPKLLSTDLEYATFLNLAYAEAKMGLPVSAPDFSCRDWSICHNCANSACPAEDSNFIPAGKNTRYYIEYNLLTKSYKCSEKNTECMRERCECDLNFIRKTQVMDLDAAINRTPQVSDCKKPPKKPASQPVLLHQRMSGGIVEREDTPAELKSCCKTGYATWAMLTVAECSQI